MIVSQVGNSTISSAQSAAASFLSRYPFIKNDQFTFLFETVLTAYLEGKHPDDFKKFVKLREDMGKLWTSMQTLLGRMGGFGDIDKPGHEAELAELNLLARSFHQKTAEYTRLKGSLELAALRFASDLTEGKHKNLLANDVAQFFKNSKALRQKFQGRENLYQSYLMYFDSDLAGKTPVLNAAEFAKYLGNTGLFPEVEPGDWANKPNPFLSKHLFQ